MFGLFGISALLGFLLAAAVCWLLIKLPLERSKLFRDDTRGVQKAHTDAKVLRIGGAAILIGFVLAAVYSAGEANAASNAAAPINPYYFLALVVVAFLAGLLEDLVKDVPQVYRLLLSFIAAALVCGVFDAGFYYSGSAWLDRTLLASPWLAYPVAIFMMGGVMHGINIIDGYNGLSGGLALMALSGIAYVALQVGDAQIVLLCCALMGAILGVMVFNYPRGKIFIGDGGAYMLGFFIAAAALLLVNRNTQVSPWFPLLLIALPVWETLFSIFRRKVMQRAAATEPDAQHLHNLVYKKIVCRLFPKRTALFRNSAVAPLMWGFALIGLVPALLLWDNTAGLFISAWIFVLIYCSAYFLLRRL